MTVGPDPVMVPPVTTHSYVKVSPSASVAETLAVDVCVSNTGLGDRVGPEWMTGAWFVSLTVRVVLAESLPPFPSETVTETLKIETTETLGGVNITDDPEPVMLPPVVLQE